MTEPALEASGRRSVLPTLTGLRWWAALVVFGYHLSVSTGWIVARPFGFGQGGVAFFFVLSGFVLTWAFRPGTPAVQFYRRRFARVFPSYFVVLLVVIAITLVWPSGPFFHNVPGLLGNLTLTQAWLVNPEWIYAYNSPGWSLSGEAFFYASFPVVFAVLVKLSPRQRVRVAAAVGMVGLLSTLTLAMVGFGGSIAFPNPLVRLPQFVLGMAAAMFVLDYKPKWRSMLWPSILLVVSLPVAILAPLFPLQDYVLLPAILVIIVVSATRDLSGVRSWLGSRPMVYLGEISFCFYLVHDPILRLLTEGVWDGVTWTAVTGIVPAATGLALSVAAAALVHHLIERPGQQLLGRGARRTVAPS